MNYDHFERQVLGYGPQMARHADRSRMLRSTPASRLASTARAPRPVRFHLAAGLRSLADHLDTTPAHLA